MAEDRSELAYLEVIDFIAAGATTRQVADFHPSAQAQRRVSELLERHREGLLSEEEIAELDHYVELEHLMRMAKARARQMLAVAG